MTSTYPPEARMRALAYTRRRRAVMAYRLLILAALWAAAIVVPSL